jgi:carboxymethylenebutenolidase
MAAIVPGFADATTTAARRGRCVQDPVMPRMRRAPLSSTASLEESTMSDSHTAGSGLPAATPHAGHAQVHTDTTGLDCGPVVIASNGLDMPAYHVRPAGRTDLPVLLVVSEIFGVHEHIADIARRFAKLGYLAIAPDLFVRQGDAKRYQDMQRLVAEVIEKVPDTQVMDDLDATLEWARTHGGDVARLGITGFCWGGRITWMYAAHQPAVRAGVAWYGKLKVPPTPQKPRHPIDVAGALHAPVLGLYGGQDASIPMTAVEEMRAALARGGAAARACEIVVYPDAGHAFLADYRPSYREAEARDGWRRCLEWLARHGVG